MKTHTTDPESDYSQRCMCVCVCVGGRGLWQQKVHCLRRQREGGGRVEQAAQRLQLGERETKRGEADSLFLSSCGGGEGED